MKRLLSFSLSIMMALVAVASQSIASNNTVTATVNKTWVEVDVEQNGKKGIRVHTEFTIQNCNGKSATINIFVANSQGAWVNANDENYKNSDGYVYLGSNFTPRYDNTKFNDYKLFIPYDAINFENGTKEYTCRPYIWYNDKYIADGDGAKFTYTKNSSNVGGKVTAKVNSTKIVHDVEEGGKKGMRIHANFNVYNGNGKEGYAYVFITDSLGNFIKGKGDATCTKEGSVYVKKKITPTYDNSLYEDLKLFFPLSHISMNPGRHKYYCTVYIKFDNEYIANGEKISFIGTSGNENKELSAKVNSSRIEHDIVQDGKKGMKIHANFNVYNAKGKTGYAYVFITDSEGKYVKGKGEASCTTDGSVYVKRELTPAYDNTIYKDFQFFFPLEHISMKPGKHNYNCIVYINFNDKYIANGENLSFVGTSGGVNNNNNNNNNYKGNLASIEWLNMASKVTSGSYRLKAGIKSSSKIEEVNIFVNGQSYRGINAVNNDGYDMLVDKELDLVLGSNTIVVEVKNAAGLAKTEKIISYVKSTRTVKGCIVDNNGKPVVGATIIAPDSQYGAVSDINGNFTINIPNDVYRLHVSYVGMNEKEVPVEDFMRISMSKKSQGVAQKKTLGGKRLALVVGNADYSEGRLKNPVNDATDLSNKLKSLGFDVIEAYNQTNRGMIEKIREFGVKARNYDVALFFYAGHGIQHNGVNYLIPVGANIKSETDIEFECTDVNRVLAQMDDARCEMKILILDACRNNPFERSWHRSAGTRGLSFMKAPKGTFITYATAPGDVAQDGTGRNSPYTEALLQTLDVPNLSIFEVFQQVLDLVSKKTNEMQNPWQSSSFRGDFYFNKK